MAKYHARDPVDDGVNEHARSILDLTKEEMANEPKETAAVARGRTILAEDESVPKRVVGFTKDNVPIERPRLKELVEGKPFTGPRSEIKRLRELGYLFDPAKIATDEEAKQLDKYGEPVTGGGGVGYVNAGQAG